MSKRKGDDVRRRGEGCEMKGVGEYYDGGLEDCIGGVIYHGAAAERVAALVFLKSRVE